MTKAAFAISFILTLFGLQDSQSFQLQIVGRPATTIHNTRKLRTVSPLTLASEKIEEDDWRDFRAKLVMKYREDNKSDVIQTQDGITSGKAGTWAYESGKIIEKGSIILARPPSSPISSNYIGLSQQYFHKSIILVLQADPQFTKGIVLNRPSNLILSDDDFINEDGSPLEMSDPDNRWKAWFGGEIAGILDEEPDIICLHSLIGEQADEVSETIMKNIKITTLDGARKLVSDGLATPQDFRTFIGHCGWENGQLQDELNDNLWYVVATDSTTVLDELKKNDAGGELMDVGIESWKFLMTMIGKQVETTLDEDGFEDRMLREWARIRLNFSDSGEDDTPLLDKMANNSQIKAGTVLRAAPSKYNPFLLQDQEYHKSIILVIQDDETISVGVILNLPTSSSIEIQISDESDDEDDGDGEVVGFEMLERYGGRFNDISDGQESNLIFLHCNDDLKAEKIGKPVGGESQSEIWSLDSEEAIQAIASGLARPEDFIVISGLSVWEKSLGGIEGGLHGEVNKGLFQVVDNLDVPTIFDLLTEQKLLTPISLEENIELIYSAWADAGPDDEVEEIQDDTQELIDIAFKRWIKAFLVYSIDEQEGEDKPFD